MFLFMLFVVVSLSLAQDVLSRRLTDMVSRTRRTIFRDLTPPRVLSPWEAHSSSGSSQPPSQAIVEEEVLLGNVQVLDVPILKALIPLQDDRTKEWTHATLR